MRFSSVVSLHTNTYGCGVAKFSKMLADRLGVPFRGLMDEQSSWGDHPLWSLKYSECEDGVSVCQAMNLQPYKGAFSVFWHDKGAEFVNAKAAHVFHADPSLGPNGLWCPSLLPEPKQRMVRLFSFGMAHKLQTSRYVRVREALEQAGLDFHLRVSVGLHEGTSLADATQHFDALKQAMGPDKVTILGCLSDEAVAEELDHANYVVAFFETGARANNTTIHAAVAAGRPIITNYDADTPETIRRRTRNIDTMGLNVDEYPYTWDNLISEMERICAHSQSATAR